MGSSGRILSSCALGEQSRSAQSDSRSSPGATSMRDATLPVMPETVRDLDAA
jgi:hypothetical protein